MSKRANVVGLTPAFMPLVVLIGFLLFQRIAITNWIYYWPAFVFTIMVGPLIFVMNRDQETIRLLKEKNKGG